MIKTGKKNAARSGPKKGPATGSFPERYTTLPWMAVYLTAAILIIYGRAVGFHLGKFDEELLILTNLPLLTDISMTGEMFRRDAFLSLNGSEFYRPLQNITFMIDAHLSGAAGWAYYATNMLLHLGACLALFSLMTLTGADRRAALLLTLLFCVSPLLASAIPWAPARGDLLIGLLAPLSLIGYIRFLRDKKWKWLLLCQLALLLALFSKETAILLPAAWLLFSLSDRPTPRPTGPPYPLALVLPYILSILLIALYLFARIRVVQPENAVDAYGIASFLFNLRTIPEVLSKFVFPFNLAPMAGYSLAATVAGLALLLLLALALRRRKGRDLYMMLFGVSWFLLFLLPGIPHRHVMGSAAYDYLEHRSYLPLMGIIMTLGTLLTPWIVRRKPAWLPGVLALLILLCGLIAWERAGAYRDPVAFYDRAVEANPHSALALSNRGLIRERSGDLPAALADHEAALSVMPGYIKAMVNRANVLDLMNRPAEAEPAYRQAIALDTSFYPAHLNLANLLFKLQRYDEAMTEYTAAVALNPSSAQAFNNMGVIRMFRDDTAGSMIYFNQAIQADPRFFQSWLNRGKLWYNQNQKEKACTDWERAALLGDAEAAALLRQYCGK